MRGKFYKVCVGGTFDHIHLGHRKLLAKAFEIGDIVFIGLTADKLGGKKDFFPAYKERKRRLEAYFKAQKWKNYVIGPIFTRFGTAHEQDVDAIVVSSETYPLAKKINLYRKKHGLARLEIYNIGRVLAADGVPISSTRIRRGEIDENGNLRGLVKINVGSTNEVKLNAVRNVMSKIFGDVSVRGVRVRVNKISSQPFEQETIRGAISRAKSAIGDAQFGVGIEAGLFWNKMTKQYFDVQYCAVVDRGRRVTLGHGSGFAYPPEVINLVKTGKTVSEAIEKTYGIKNIGRNQGAIGLLSNGRLTRTKLTEQAVLMAMIPRMNRGKRTVSPSNLLF